MRKEAGQLLGSSSTASDRLQDGGLQRIGDGRLEDEKGLVD